MTTNCMNCGAMLLQGATVCPVCRQPVAPTQSNSGWTQQPNMPPGASWQQPGPPPFGTPPGGSKPIWVIALGLALLLMIGVAGYLVYFVTIKKTVDEIDKEQEELRNLVSPEPVQQDNTNSSLPPQPSPPGTRNRNSPKAPISGGVLNGKAISLPKPTYPPVAKAAHASGTVTVQVTVDEEGKVISANAVSGHPLLQAAAVQAARQARFSPTLLAGQPVKVTGVITYNFVAE
jgi:TonB family protein